MAFNFNWSPLTADAGFYERARDLLTTALNKSPKPPIIVDDIFVTEFNLGSVPPDLEILEIGDLAEDRFRGIFKMCYSGDAFLTLKTRVQVCAISVIYDGHIGRVHPGRESQATGIASALLATDSMEGASEGAGHFTKPRKGGRGGREWASGASGASGASRLEPGQVPLDARDPNLGPET